MSVNGLHRDRVRDRDRVSGRVRVSVRVRDRVRVRVCHPDSSGNLLTQRKMEFAQIINRRCYYDLRKYSFFVIELQICGIVCLI